MSCTDRDDYAEKLHNARGFYFILNCKRCVKAKRLSLDGVEPEQLVSLKILYLGPATAGSESLHRVHPEKDPFTYCQLQSPFPEELNPLAAWGFIMDKQRQIWAPYYCLAYLKHPVLYSHGLKIVFQVPGILAEKRPVLELFCNEELICREVLDKEGIHTRIISLKDISRTLVEYMMDVRRQQRIIMQEFQRICKKYSLNYYLICGGLIGIVRDGDLLPWDDDLDIAMMRSHYDSFKKAVSIEWADNKDFLLLEPNEYGEDLFLDFMNRILYMKETIHGDPFSRNGDKGRRDIHNHLPMDIYVMDRVYQSSFRQTFRVKEQLLLYVLSLGHRESFNVADYKRQYNGLKRAVIKGLMAIGKRIPFSFLWRQYQRVIRKGDRKHLSQNLYQSNGYYNCLTKQFPEAVFGEGRVVECAGMQLRIPDQAEEFLNIMYKDHQNYPYYHDRKANFTPEEKGEE